MPALRGFLTAGGGVIRHTLPQHGTPVALTDSHVAYLDAPVSGSAAPARRGTPVRPVSGPEDGPGLGPGDITDDLGSSVRHVGTGVEGSAVKPAVNAWTATAAAAPGPLLQAVRDRLDETVAAGHGEDGLAAVDHLRKAPSTV